VAVDEMMSGNYALCQHLTEGNFELQQLSLDYPEPADVALYEALFQCPVLFGQNTVEMKFDSSLLNLKLKNADAETVRSCEERCRQLLDRLRHSDNIVERVRRTIFESPCDRRDLETVAAKLFMSARTLRRHLAKAETSFRRVLDDVRQGLAIDYLCATDISIDKIAFLLGYFETSSFRHAFKQWTGESPTSYRNKRK
jgi:AraC-like DNA-binding protein